MLDLLNSIQKYDSLKNGKKQKLQDRQTYQRMIDSGKKSIDEIDNEIKEIDTMEIVEKDNVNKLYKSKHSELKKLSKEIDNMVDSGVLDFGLIYQQMGDEANIIKGLNIVEERLGIQVTKQSARKITMQGGGKEATVCEIPLKK